MKNLWAATLTLAAMAYALPAHAQSSAAIPDPSGLTLFALGVAGLIVGRKVATRDKNQDGE